MPSIRHFERNKHGRDFVVGDIQGAFFKLKAALENIGFNPDRDRLFSVGDLVDRGPESHHVLDWLKKPWFHAVKGNHEDMTIFCHRDGRFDEETYIKNGGLWFLTLPAHEKEEIVCEFEDLPLAFEIETEKGSVGVVHAEVPFSDWGKFKDALKQEDLAENLVELAMWGRSKVKNFDETPVKGVDHVFVGHSALKDATQLGNVHYIDTGAYHSNGKFTIVNLSSF